MRTHSQKPPRKTATRRGMPALAPELLIDVIDELDLIDGMLRGVPQLHMVVQLLEEQGTSDLAHDPVGQWLRVLGAGLSVDPDDDSQTIRDAQHTLSESPDALVEAARWKLQRVRDLLEAARLSTRNRKGV